MRRFNHCTADNCAVLKHILKVNKVTVMHVLCKIVSIMEVDKTLLVSLNDFGSQEDSLCNVLTYLTCHIVTLNAVNCGVLIGVLLLNLLVIALNK